jgi:hypothetical protein
MKKISLIISLIFTSVTGILTSCSEDYPGPDPVDVTANYSNKFSNPNPTLQRRKYDWEIGRFQHSKG